MTRDACITDPVLLGVLIAANAVIFLSYASIPLSLLWVMLRARKIPFPSLAWLFAAFILSCGLTHGCAILVFFKPAFYMEATLLSATAIVSFTTAILLRRARKALLDAVNEAIELAEAIRRAGGAVEA